MQRGRGDSEATAHDASGSTGPLSQHPPSSALGCLASTLSFLCVPGSCCMNETGRNDGQDKACVCVL